MNCWRICNCGELGQIPEISTRSVDWGLKWVSNCRCSPFNTRLESRAAGLRRSGPVGPDSDRGAHHRAAAGVGGPSRARATPRGRVTCPRSAARGPGPALRAVSRPRKLHGARCSACGWSRRLLGGREGGAISGSHSRAPPGGHSVRWGSGGGDRDDPLESPHAITKCAHNILARRKASKA